MNTDNNLQRAIEMAQASIYDGAKYLGKWRMLSVYEPTFNDNEPRFIGFPQFIIASGGSFRWTSDDEESRAIMNHFWKD